jgi:hypothetical protein
MAALLGMFAAQPVFAQATPTKTSGTDSFTETVYNPCTDENVDFTVDVSWTLVTVQGPNGWSGHATQQFTFTGTGESSGNSYSASGALNENVSGQNGSASVNTGQVLFNFVSPGSGSTWMLQQTFRVVSDANGNMTVMNIGETSTCH